MIQRCARCGLAERPFVELERHTLCEDCHDAFLDWLLELSGTERRRENIRASLDF